MNTTAQGISQLDSKRRIILPKDTEERYGKKFVIVRLQNEILLKPLPRDPLKALMREGRKLRGVSVAQFEQEAEDALRERA